MLNRRDALFTTGSMVVSASLGALACGPGQAVAQNTTPAHKGTADLKGDNALLSAAHDCMLKGDACLSHCIALLGTGDTSMAECARTVRLMNAMMVGLAAAAASGTPHLQDVARVAMKFCQDCEASCKPHAGHHTACKECAEACGRTIAACQKAVG